jgi:hypothetical protein
MGKMLPETCWAAFTQLNNKRFYNWVCVQLVILFEYLKMHGTTNHKFKNYNIFRAVFEPASFRAASRRSFQNRHVTIALFIMCFNTLKAELNPICHLPALLGAHSIFHVSRKRVKPTVNVLFLKSRVPLLKWEMSSSSKPSNVRHLKRSPLPRIIYLCLY